MTGRTGGRKEELERKLGKNQNSMGHFWIFEGKKFCTRFLLGKPEAPAENPNRKKFQKGVDFETKESYNV